MPFLLRSTVAALVVLAAAVPLAAQAASSSDPVRLRKAPVKVAGLWCGAGLLHEFSLDIAQQYQDINARLVRKGRVREITGRMEGATLVTDPQRNETMELLARGNELQITAATGVLALARGQSFTRAAGGSCTH